ncbi:MAG: hypothetical protein CMH54_01670 [Myxococcales bacterium]|nr:hypothetical protein [Myxococcales bacterium]
MSASPPVLNGVRIAGSGPSATWVAGIAQESGVLTGFPSVSDDFAGVDLILIDDSPEATRDWLHRVAQEAQPGTLVMDFSANKEAVTEFADDVIPLTLHYLSVSIIDRGGSNGAAQGIEPTIIFTPSMATRPEALERAQDFWKALGFSVFQCLAHEHDIMVSGLRDGPRLLAAAYLKTLDRLYPDLGELRRINAPFTRHLRDIAGTIASPESNTDNAHNIGTILETMIEELRQLQTAIESRDATTIQEFHHEVQSIGLHLGQGDPS